jgi:transposase
LARPEDRMGMSTTALVVKVGERSIALDYSGRAHAGENLKTLLPQRAATQEKPLVLSDALTSHEADEAMRRRCHCLAHGRRKCSAREDVFPDECTGVLEALRQVVDHEDKAAPQQLSAQERLASHQVYSGPLMEGLKQWRAKRCDERLVAPKSSLGKALAYLVGHGDTLPRFLSVPGAPLDNNLVERALKLVSRQRKNSLFFATAHRAYIARVLTRLMAPCLHAGVNALQSLGALQEHRSEVFAAPAAWLPWTSQVHLAPP